MKRNKVYNMVLTSIFGAIIFILGLIPNVGFIQVLPGVAITIVHIPVIIAIFVLPLSSVLGLGFIFGLSSLIVAATQATQPFDQAFIYPWISILPRMLFAFVGFYILKLFQKLKVFKYSKQIIFAIISAVTAFALFFGIHETVKNVNFNKSNEYNTTISKYKESEDFNADTLKEMLINYQVMRDKEEVKYVNVKKTTTIILIVVILLVVFVYFYLIFYSKYSDKYFYIPSVFILSTFLHTIFVIGGVTLFKPALFYDMLGSDTSLISVILGIALTNGLVEAIFGAIIGTPIVVAITNKMEEI